MTRGRVHPGTRRTRGGGHRTLVRTRGVEPPPPPLEFLDRDIKTTDLGWQTSEGWQYLSVSVFLMYVCQITSVFYFSISVFYFSILTELHPIIQY